MTDIVSSVVTPNQSLVGFRKVDIPYVLSLTGSGADLFDIILATYLQCRRFADGYCPGKLFRVGTVVAEKLVDSRAGRVCDQSGNGRSDIPKYDADRAIVNPIRSSVVPACFGMLLVDLLKQFILFTYNKSCPVQVSGIRPAVQNKTS